MGVVPQLFLPPDNAVKSGKGGNGTAATGNPWRGIVIGVPSLPPVVSFADVAPMLYPPPPTSNTTTTTPHMPPEVQQQPLPPVPVNPPPGGSQPANFMFGKKR